MWFWRILSDWFPLGLQSSERCRVGSHISHPNTPFVLQEPGDLTTKRIGFSGLICWDMSSIRRAPKNARRGWVAQYHQKMDIDPCTLWQLLRPIPHSSYKNLVISLLEELDLVDLFAVVWVPLRIAPKNARRGWVVHYHQNFVIGPCSLWQVMSPIPHSSYRNLKRIDLLGYEFHQGST